MNKPIKPPRVLPDQFHLYDATSFDLIPLHTPTATRTKKGKTYRVGKAPIDNNWTKKAYDTQQVIARCIAENRNGGVRLAAHDLIVDVDPRHGGNESLVEFAKAMNIDLDDWPLVNTGSGGRHYYGMKPPGLKINTKLEAYPGLEFKTAGSQVVAAGSIHPDTMRPYQVDDFNPPLGQAKQWPANVLQAVKRKPRESSGEGAGLYAPEQLAAMLARLNVEDFRDEQQWRDLMMACHHATDGNGIEEFIAWSINDPEYSDDGDLIRLRWNSCSSDRADAITAGTLHKALADAGAGDAIPRPDAADDFADAAIEDDEFEEKPTAAKSTSTELIRVEDRGLKINERSNVAPDTIANAYCAVVRSGLEPAWDELKQNTVLRTPNLPWDEGYGRIVNDHVLRLLRMYYVNLFQGVDYQPSVDNLANAVATVAYSAKFNPVLEYIDPLKWDGVKRVEKLFAAYFNCDDDAYTRGVSICFAVAAVRRMRKPGCKFDTMPIMRGPQGWMKSTAIRALFGDEFFSDADLGSLRDKDSAMKLRGYWVQEFPEIESLTRAETGSLKAFCSRATDRQRDPYGRVVDNAPRRCVFIATVNEGGYLKDSTGARRFWPLEVRKPIDVARIKADRDQIWAEAAMLEAQGVSDVLPRELWSVAGERQADQTSDDPWADAIRTFLEARQDAHDAHNEFENAIDADAAPVMPPDRVHTSELFEVIAVKTADQTKDKAQRLRTVMESVLGWHHRRNVRVIDRNAAGYTRAQRRTV